jgi:hypothetical protein
MKNRSIICFLVLSALVLPVDLRGQSVKDDGDARWRQVQSLPPGQVVEVRRLHGKTVRGSVVSIVDNVLTVKAGSGQVDLRAGAIGAAIGALSGVVIIVALDGALTDGNGTSEEAAAALGAIGAGIGLAIGLPQHRYSTIYKVH